MGEERGEARTRVTPHSSLTRSKKLEKPRASRGRKKLKPKGRSRPSRGAESQRPPWSLPHGVAAGDAHVHVAPPEGFQAGGSRSSRGEVGARRETESHLLSEDGSTDSARHRARTANPGLRACGGWPARCAMAASDPLFRALVRNPPRYRLIVIHLTCGHPAALLHVNTVLQNMFTCYTDHAHDGRVTCRRRRAPPPRGAPAAPR